jgi:murein L,D-transpeptidase YcbB/YkuD
MVSSVITSTIFQPTWTVPTTVMTEDMPKKLKKVPTYFEDYNVSVYVKDGNGTRKINPHDVNWTKVEPQGMLHYTFVQDPGPKNALGQIKFNFANPYGVYLHDTAYPELFAEEKRFFSSGCIRTQSPEKIVSYFFGEGFKKPKEKMAVRSVPKPIAIQTVYWTAWADQGGIIHYRDDIYSKDATCDEGRLAGCTPVEGWKNLISKKVLQRAVAPSVKKDEPAEVVTPDGEEGHDIETRKVVQ